ncbi:hypothetical protein [Beggiatoa leptomitoformis]|uniref:Uncharacterized protein n=1 Tax=Beggiatoa leptomitoformis TaxID=288004 RepID=A0A2N9YBP4_9GAMM|nr:hypothetical protein [Beggiatoa leptomitoformis]ALG66800.1 hypothetical protein AL038_02565 [Beggiatoa leptomitoformis]AUI67852.1 hypothetical protein BLE401_03480 [Beggiatoa leptomitoformis]
MDTLVLHPTSTAQWHALVNEAESMCHARLGEELESYLVFLLMRYVNAADIANSVLAVEYLQTAEMTGKLRADQLRDVGDKCLLYSGLFPGRAQRRRVNISYYVDLGVSAYGVLADSLADMRATLYEALSARFVALMDVLQATREVNTHKPCLQPLDAMDLWSDTNSPHALATLALYSNGFPVKTTQPQPDSTLYARFKNKPHTH